MAVAAASLAPVAFSATAGSTPVIKKAVVEVSSREQQCRTSHHSAKRWPSVIFSLSSNHTAASEDVLTSEVGSTPKTVEAGKLEPVAVSPFKAIPQSSKNRGVGEGHSTSKLKIAQASGACRTLLAPQTLHGRRGCFLLSSSHSQERSWECSVSEAKPDFPRFPSTTIQIVLFGGRKRKCYSSVKPACQGG